MLHRVKKHNDINEGKWIGVGGHAEGQESPEECLLREVKEETGLTLTSYKNFEVWLHLYVINVNRSLCVYLQPTNISVN